MPYVTLRSRNKREYYSMCFSVADTENTCCHSTISKSLSNINRSRDFVISFLKCFIEVCLCEKESSVVSLTLLYFALFLHSMHEFPNQEYLYLFEVPNQIYEDTSFTLFTGLHELRCSQI